MTNKNNSVYVWPNIQATLDVSVSIQEPLLSDIQISESNMLMVTVETAYSVPDIWDPASTPLSSYVAALQIPLSAAVKQMFTFRKFKTCK